MYERQFLDAAINNDYVRMEAIKRLNNREYAYKTANVNGYGYRDVTRDRLIAVFGEAYDSRCRS